MYKTNEKYKGGEKGEKPVIRQEKKIYLSSCTHTSTLNTKGASLPAKEGVKSTIQCKHALTEYD